MSEFPCRPVCRRKREDHGGILSRAPFRYRILPCATPVLVVILTFVASQGKVVYGTILLFVYAIGHVALIVAAGISAGLVQKFVENRGAMAVSTWTKKLFGILVIAAGVYIIYKNVWI